MEEAGAPIGRLWLDQGRLMYQDASGGPWPVRLRWFRPLSGRDGPVSVLLAGKKREVACFPSLGALSGETRRLAEEELARSLVLPRITRIRRVVSRFGNYYWDVETDLGDRKFLLSSPESNSFSPLPDMVALKDGFDNCYLINPVSGLDPDSRREFDKALWA